jgi:hypothetical protein
MVQPMSAVSRCQWCSAELPNPDVDRCPSCGAPLASSSASEAQLPGVTTLDAEAIVRARAEVSRPRSRILSFITGDMPPETGGPASAESLAPPSDDVRREMLRLQLEAERADLEAETIALKSDVIAQHGIHIGELTGDVPEGEPAEAVSAEPAAQPARGAETTPEPAAAASAGASTPAGPDGDKPAA